MKSPNNEFRRLNKFPLLPTHLGTLYRQYFGNTSLFIYYIPTQYLPSSILFVHSRKMEQLSKNTYKLNYYTHLKIQMGLKQMSPSIFQLSLKNLQSSLKNLSPSIFQLSLKQMKTHLKNLKTQLKQMGTQIFQMGTSSKIFEYSSFLVESSNFLDESSTILD